MPTQVQRRPSDPLAPSSAAAPGSHASTLDQIAATRAQEQYHLNLQHKEALRLALGSILTPKRPPLTPTSRSSSGTASPAYPFGFPASSSSPSGTHTPAGPPPQNSNYPYSNQGHGPVSTDHLHVPAHGYHSHGHHHPLPPSRLGRSSSTNSPIDSTPSPNSAHPSPRPVAHFQGSLNPNPNLLNEPHLSPVSSAPLTPVPADIEPLPPAYPGTGSGSPAVPATVNIDNQTQTHTQTQSSGSADHQRPVRPSIMPLHPHPSASGGPSLSSPSVVQIPSSPTSSTLTEGPTVVQQNDTSAKGTAAAGAGGSGSNTPKSKFLQTLQSKSAWDALIHGSFS